ncbi:hypothetical protein AGABI2DRAFT_195218 [Agaricus bisporus var. bisporus H97]|uniref:hypothetical protein n=1 Tax=Agaricus bisporus var. bisporus (strain H97 / ATCC MYA-4626 / FGSC 10389) TaxID=936046 RepID=UPI00029F7F57|nr:hypothetical protein AGABI2DRAFT_195218 [Agaricus bisporus var. bisporus H97]EKV43692.1 hypothetical protein AGABI2DRAFT_195218 [Agaricus bisporus var. bisporus H97]
MSICMIMSKLYTNSLLSLVQHVRQQIDDDVVIGSKQSNSNLVFRGVSQSQRSKWTITNVSKTSTRLVGSDLELNASERSGQNTENIKRPEIPDVFSKYWFLEATKGPGHNLRAREPEAIDVESWISFRRIPRRAWLNWPINRRSSL